MKSQFGSTYFGNLFGGEGDVGEQLSCYINKSVSLSCEVYKQVNLNAVIP
jgi:hypothetical protein